MVEYRTLSYQTIHLALYPWRPSQLNNFFPSIARRDEDPRPWRTPLKPLCFNFFMNGHYCLHVLMSSWVLKQIDKFCRMTLYAHTQRYDHGNLVSYASIENFPRIDLRFLFKCGSFRPPLVCYTHVLLDITLPFLR